MNEIPRPAGADASPTAMWAAGEVPGPVGDDAESAGSWAAGEVPGPVGDDAELAGSWAAGEVPGPVGDDAVVTLPRSFYERSPLVVAPALLGKVLVAADGRRGRIVEVEAYCGSDDPASHAYRGRTARNDTMWRGPGLLYIYFTYGMHWCANATCTSDGPSGAGAVLIRALEPLTGLEAMRQARWRTQRHQTDRDLCRGPGRLCQALGWDRALDGADLVTVDRGVRIGADGAAPPPIAVTTRIGLRVATDRPWRFVVAGSPWASGPAVRARRRPSRDIGARKVARAGPEAGTVLPAPKNVVTGKQRPAGHPA